MRLCSAKRDLFAHEIYAVPASMTCDPSVVT